MKYFVWIAGLRGPIPQIWDEKDKTAEGKPVKTLFKVEIPYSAKIDDMVAKYPFEAKP